MKHVLRLSLLLLLVLSVKSSGLFANSKKCDANIINSCDQKKIMGNQPYTAPEDIIYYDPISAKSSLIGIQL